MNNRKALLVVVLPLVVFCSWLGKVMLDANSAKHAILSIQGFDPRDLLSGHYLRYRVDWKGPVCGPQRYGEQCVCLSDEVPARATWNGACDDRPNGCAHFVRGQCNGGSFEAGLERYYFPESWRGKLVTVPPNATVEVSLTSSGKAIVHQLLVEGRPLSEWIGEQK